MQETLLKRFNAFWSRYGTGILNAGAFMVLAGVLLTAGNGMAAGTIPDVDAPSGADFTSMAWNAVYLMRFIGIFIVAGGIVAAAISFWTGSQESKNILWKTVFTGILIIMAPSIIGLIVDTLGFSSNK